MPSLEQSIRDAVETGDVRLTPALDDVSSGLEERRAERRRNGEIVRWMDRVLPEYIRGDSRMERAGNPWARFQMALQIESEKVALQLESEKRKSHSKQSAPSKSGRRSLDAPTPQLPNQPGSALNSSTSSLPSPPRRSNANPETLPQRPTAPLPRFSANAPSTGSKSSSTADGKARRAAAILAAVSNPGSSSVDTGPSLHRDQGDLRAPRQGEASASAIGRAELAVGPRTSNENMERPAVLAKERRRQAIYATFHHGDPRTTIPSSIPIPIASAATSTRIVSTPRDTPNAEASSSRSGRPSNLLPTPTNAAGPSRIPIAVPMTAPPSQAARHQRPPQPNAKASSSRSSFRPASSLSRTPVNAVAGPSRIPIRPAPPTQAAQPQQPPRPQAQGRRIAVNNQTFRHTNRVEVSHDKTTGVDHIRHLPKTNKSKYGDTTGPKPNDGCSRCGHDSHKTLYPVCCTATSRWSDGQQPACFTRLASDGKTDLIMRSGRLVCRTFLWGGQCRSTIKPCPDSHRCTICRSTLHHPSDCRMFKPNGHARMAPIPDAPIEGSSVWIAARPVQTAQRAPPTNLDKSKRKAKPTPATREFAVHSSTSMLHGRPLSPRALPPLVQDLLGEPVPDFISRVVVGRELDDASSDLDRDTVNALLAKIYDSHLLTLFTTDKDEASKQTTASARALHEELKSLEREAMNKDDRVRQGVIDTDKHLKKRGCQNRYQLPDGLPELAPLLLVGHYPNDHTDSRALTTRAFSTRQLVRSGLVSPTVSQDPSLAFINTIPIHLPVDSKDTPSYSNGKSLPKSLIERCEDHMRERLSSLQGYRLVVTFGTRNRSIVESVIKGARTDGYSVYEWVKKLPHISDVEMGASRAGLIAATALAEGEGNVGYFSRRTVDLVNTETFRPAITDFSNSVDREPGVGMSGGLQLNFALVEKQDGGVLFLALEHPQTANLHTTSFAAVARTNIGVQFAVDYQHGFHRSGEYREHCRWVFAASLSRVRVQQRVQQEFPDVDEVEHKDWHELKLLEVVQRNASKWNQEDLFRFAPRHLTRDLLELYEDIEFVEEGQGDPVTWGADNVIGHLLWLARKRAAPVLLDEDEW